MTQRIQRLNPQLANQIAAGEVIERPASVVKELLENSLDAGSTDIHIDIEQGGIGLIKIRDNGSGIIKEDLDLALSRHATSKICAFADLQNLLSLGFRGEALASVSSVSRLTLMSCARGALSAWQVTAEGLDMLTQVQPASHPIGTTVVVQDLFYNTPARRKFLRSEKTELLHIEEVFKRIVLSHYNVAFTLKYNDRVIHKLPIADTENRRAMRVETLCGKAFIENSLFVDFHAVDLRLSGWLGLPDIARSQNDLQYFYVNGRVVRDKLLNHAVRQAYTDKLYEGRHPCYVLYLDLAPASVDVNVHPTKHEVRFRESRLVHDFIARHLMQALVGDISQPVPAEMPPVFIPESHYQKPVHQVKEQMAVYKTLHDWPDEVSQPEVKEIILPLHKEIFPVYADSIKPFEVKWIATIRDKYFLLEDDKGLILLNAIQCAIQHVVDVLESALKGMEIPIQPLLIPQTVSVSVVQMENLLKYTDWFAKAGIVYSQLSPAMIRVTELAVILKELPIEKTLQAIADCLSKIDPEQMPDPVLAMIAHHAVPHESTGNTELLIKKIKLDKIAHIRLTWNEIQNQL